MTEVKAEQVAISMVDRCEASLDVRDPSRLDHHRDRLEGIARHVDHSAHVALAQIHRQQERVIASDRMTAALEQACACQRDPDTICRIGYSSIKSLWSASNKGGPRPPF